MAFDDDVSSDGPVMSVQPLAYDTPRLPTPTIWLHYVARACGVVPLAIGTLIFFLFLITRSARLPALGLLTILGGCCMAFVGVVCATVYLYQAKRATEEDRERARRQAFLDLAIIIANFPAAFIMAWLGIGMLQGLD